jgi:sodium transport system permease protein
LPSARKHAAKKVGESGTIAHRRELLRRREVTLVCDAAQLLRYSCASHEDARNMRMSVVQTIWFREVRDQLRDRRTVLMLLVLPLLLYPGLGLAFAQFAFVLSERELHVGVVGKELVEAETDPPPNLADGGRLYLRKLPPLFDPKAPLFHADLFQNREFQPRTLKQHHVHLVFGDEKKLQDQLARGELDAILVLTPSFVADVRAGERTRVVLRLRGEMTQADRNDDGIPEDIWTSDDDRSRQALTRLENILSQWNQLIAEARLKHLGAPDNYHKALRYPILEAKAEQLWIKLFPFFIVMMALTGALYPAIDVCAGEKERGTMETLLISPASRPEIVMGKFLTVWLFSTATAVLNLASLGFTAWQFSRVVDPGSTATGAAAAFPAPSLAALGWCVVLLVPLAAFFSAVSLALAVYARSTKEGQYFLLPLMLVTLPLTLLSLAPGVQLTYFYSVLPITGPALLLQELMSAKSAGEVPWLYIFPVLVPLAAYCYLSLHWAIHQFSREDVLFREAERIDLKLYVRRLFREKEPLPSAGMAFGCFVLILLLRWWITVGAAHTSLWLQNATSQIVGVAAPALFMALLLTSRPVQSLRIQGAFWQWLLAAPLLALAINPLMVRMLKIIFDSFPQLTEQAKPLTERLLDKDASWGWHALNYALVPAICEEIAFRGLILSGLVRRLGAGKGILVSALLFAFGHLNALQFVPTFILGLALGYITVRSGSLFPAILFHLVHNGLIITVAYFGHLHKAEMAVPDWFMEMSEVFYDRYSVMITSLCAALLVLVINRLPRRAPALAVPVGEAEK